MKFIRMNSKYLLNRFYVLQTRRYSTEFYPYISELYKKNYIKYPTQSRSAIQHDYVFDDKERLPTLKERLKGKQVSRISANPCFAQIQKIFMLKFLLFNIEFRDPVDDYRTNIGKLKQHPQLEQILNEFESILKKNKQDKSLELKSKELKSNLF